MSGAGILTRPIPSTGEALPVIGLGTWRAFDIGADDRARRRLREVLQVFLDAGERIIDSSPMYGRAEAVTGDLLAELSGHPRPFLATKVMDDRRRTRGRPNAALGSAITGRGDRPDADPQSGRLAHPSGDLAPNEAEGRIRYIGITHYATGALPELARILAAEPGIDFVQLGYSLATRAAETELLPVAAAQGVAVIANQPFEQGDLFRRVCGRAPPDWAHDFDCASWAQLFPTYILAEPAVTCVIPATNNPEHMKDNLAAGLGSLPDARQRQRIRQLWDDL
jgi:aryl-alcohol dehydrogenase-like predicted oxidoreductase